ncbi:hypothetical protein EV356DRAFT_510736 [Viridothelium virens]|uniref:Secreted protein n=1 Tax=Viridothelium virens TaxID=1048519 RepID=A0A6A6GVA1_VIRVR|nr:hypothetical protein EV356DRAFT_510736 [Viridothelium virens]
MIKISSISHVILLQSLVNQSLCLACNDEEKTQSSLTLPSKFRHMLNVMPLTILTTTFPTPEPARRCVLRHKGPGYGGCLDIILGIVSRKTYHTAAVCKLIFMNKLW